MVTRAVVVMPTLTAGGAERVASNLVNEWCQYPSTEVTLILLFQDAVFFQVDPRVRIRTLGLTPGMKPLARLWALCGTLWRLRVAVLSEQPTFVFSMMHKYNVYCLLSLWWTGTPVIISERDNALDTPIITDILRRFTYRLARAAIAQSQPGREFLLRSTSVPDVIVLPNPVPTRTVRRNDRSEGLILNVARLVPQKGHADLLQAFATLQPSNYTLVLCGDGPLREELESLSVSLGIEGQTRFLGTVADLSEWYSRAAVFAFTSYSEGFPNALAEAMIMGTPVVSYDCPTGPAEMIRHGENGFLVPLGDVGVFAQRLRQVLSSPELADEFSRAGLLLAETLDAGIVARQYHDYCASMAQAAR